MTKPPFGLRLFRRIWIWTEERRAAYLRSQLGACGAGVSFQWPVVINGPEHVRLGDRVSVNAFVHIWGQGGVSIGDDTLIASHVAITSLTHAVEAENRAGTLISRPVAIGRRVWIGSHAVILPGITVGDGAVVAAGAVVTRDVAAGAVVMGVPAKPRDG